MLYCLKQQRCTIYECKTDNVLYIPLKRRRTNVLQELTFRNLSTVRDEFELSGSRRLNEFSSLPPVPSNDKPFRVLEATEKRSAQIQSQVAHTSKHAKHPTSSMERFRPRGRNAEGNRR